MNPYTRQRLLIHPGLIVFAIFCLLLPAVFIYIHLITPSDGARLSRNEMIFTPIGVEVIPYQQGPGLLQNGDIITAVDGIDTLTWVHGVTNFPSSHPVWQKGETVTYNVLRNHASLDLEIPLGSLPLGSILSDHWSVIVFFLAAQVIAGFVYWQRPVDNAARAFFIWAFSGSHVYTWVFSLQISDIVNPVGFWLYHLAASGLWLIFWAAVLHMVIVFPKKLFQPNRPLLWILILYLSPFLVFAAYLGWAWTKSANLLEWWNFWNSGQTLIAILYSLPALVLIILQSATSRTGIERIKTRWVIYGTMISLSLGLGLYFLPSLMGVTILSPNELGVINFPFVITMAIAIWRYHLFDIDVIIRRTLVYGFLTAMLALVYFILITVLQNLISRISNQQSAFAVVLSTLSIAALFNPLRRRLQGFIDQRFYRRKYNIEKALTAFADTARDETDLELLTIELIHVASETMQPDGVSLWIIPTPANRSKGT